MRTMKDALLRISIRIQNGATRIAGEAGQTVAEYALVLLVAAAVAGALLVWAKQTGKLDGFFDAIFDKLLGSIDEAPSPTPTP